MVFCDACAGSPVSLPRSLAYCHGNGREEEEGRKEKLFDMIERVGGAQDHRQSV